MLFPRLMFDYLQKFNNLPKDLRDQVSSSSAMAALADLENKYRTDLAMTVMKVMIKSLSIQNLPIHFVSELALSAEQAQNLAQEMKDKIFFRVADYLELGASTRAWDLDKNVSLLIKETGLNLPSENLVARFKMIIATYLKGIRNKIDTRAALAKDVKIGGLNLNDSEIDRVIKVCEQDAFKNLAYAAAPVLGAAPKPSAPATRLGKIMAAAEVPRPNVKIAEYDLKQAIASGQIKKPAALDPRHELVEPAKELDLPQPELAAAALTATPVKAPSVVGAPQPVFVQKPVATPIASRQFAPSASAPIISIPPPPLPVAPVTAPVGPAKTPAAPSRPAPAPSNVRPQMHDIKPMPKVMGPLEELQFLDIVNFRRLGKTPAESTAKIFAKIKLLEEDGYDKMVAGVHAWRQSLVNRLYLALVREAVNKNRPLQAELADRQKENKESLNWEEIQAIMALNSKLVF